MKGTDMRMETNEFEASHGRKPKGRGYWGLVLTFTDGDGRFSSEEVWGNGTLTEVRKNAWYHLRREVGGAKHLLEVKVLP
jgi:hypothetical protein